MKPLTIIAFGDVPVADLAGAGHAVHAADSLSKAVAIAEQLDPDVSIVPPTLDGFRLARMLSWVRGTPSVALHDSPLPADSAGLPDNVRFAPSCDLVRAVQAVVSRRTHRS